MSYSDKQVEAIFDLILIDADGDGCWIWLGRCDKDSYGRYGKELAHRVVWKIMRGCIGPNTELDHTCYNRLCTNPDHLEEVDHAENIRRRDANRRAEERRK